MAFLVGGANSSAVTAYDIENSLRLNYADVALLADTTGSAGSDRIFTFSFWTKRSTISDSDGQSDNFIFVCSTGTFNDNNWLGLQFMSTDLLRCTTWEGDTDIRTTGVFRDPSAWYHIVLSVDTTQSTASNRLKIYVNGSLASLSQADYPDQNHDYDGVGTSGADFIIGTSVNATPAYYDHLHGYLADFAFVDGTAYAASDFGETDEDSGIWKPKALDVTWGDNGFFLEFKNSAVGSGTSSTIGADTSGEDNHFTSTNIAVTDQTTDTPTNNFATWNPLHKASNVTLSEGNCKAAIAGAGQSRSTTATIAVSKGKWYWETKYTTDVVSGFFGLVSADIGWNINATEYPSSGVSDNVGFNDGGTKYVNGSSSSYGSGFGDDDIIGVAANLDDDEVVFYVNGTAENSGTAISKTFSGTYFFVCQHQSSGGTSNFEVNFGNPPYANSSSVADENGYGAFEYAVPSGFYAVCTKNLAEFG